MGTGVTPGRRAVYESRDSWLSGANGRVSFAQRPHRVQQVRVGGAEGAVGLKWGRRVGGLSERLDLVFPRTQ